MLKKIKKVCSIQSLFWLGMVLIIDLLIFYFSSQPGAKSESQSRFVLDCFQIAENLTSQKIIRKLAHLSIYACMGICWANFFCTIKLSWRQCFLISILMCCLFAASDEWHQTFVPGRSGEFLDVCLDTLGATLGIGCMLGLRTYLSKTNQTK